MFLEKDYILWLSKIDGINLKKKLDIIETYKSAENFFKMDNSEITYYCNKNKINAKNILDLKNENVLEENRKLLLKHGIDFITKESDIYPKNLKYIDDAPLVLYILGDMPKQKNNVAIIGARKCTQYGAINSYKFGKELAQNGICVVSGMAVGIDSMAHKGAIDGKGKTIAVLGCGLDIVYPPNNKNLRDEIIENGCVISEFSIGTSPYPANFPMRNRIISGISDAIVVVESAKRSGTLITVSQALEQGRDVFAIPGNINSPMSEGTNNLIKECAYPLTDIEDILSNLKDFNKDDIKKDEDIEILLEPDEKIIYSCITKEPITIDEIIMKTDLTIQKVQYIATMLELKGYIQRLAGQKYIRAL